MSGHVWSARFRVVAVSAICAVVLPQAPALADDYPTYERVQYAIQCITRHGGAQQLIYQCSCAIDKLAAQFSIDEFVDMQTAMNAASMTGERGGGLRDNPDMRAAAKRYREAEGAALKSCGVAVK
jgi:hypothetical protein